MSQLSHFDDRGASRMVDTSDKAETLRTARASARVRMASATAALIRDKSLSKGDVLEVARLAEDIVGHPLPGSVKMGGSLKALRATHSAARLN